MVVRIIIFMLCISSCFGTLGDHELKPDGARIIWNNNSQTFSISASSLMSGSVDYKWPPADATAGGQALLSDAAGVLSWGTPTTSASHNILSGTHDAITSAVTRGDIIFGNSTPEWDDLAIGASQLVLISNGLEPSWGIVDISGGTNLAVTSPVTLTTDVIGWDSTLVDTTTWGEGSFASFVWNFDVSGTDTTITFGNGVMSLDQELSLTDDPITNIGYLDFDLDAVPATEPEARAWWNDTDHVLNISSGMGPVLQAGLENWVLVRNETGSQIDDGEVVFINGASSGRPLIELAKADKPTTTDRTIGVATMDIPTGTEGIVTTFGTVRDIDTSACSPGDQLFVSAATAGEFTPTQPAYPNYIMKIGNCQTSDVSTGKIAVNVIGRVEDIIENGWNGGFLESINFAVTSAVGVVTGTLENDDNTKDLTMNFSDGFTILDTTSSPVTVVLTTGTDDIPATRFVYVPIGTKTLTEGSDWPAEEHIKVATTVLRTAATTATDGALRNQNWNDHIADSSISMGHIQHIGERVRQDDAKWSSGAEGSLTIVSGSTPDDVFVAATGGKVYQLHKQDFPALDLATGDDIHVANDSVAPFKTITNLNSELTDAAGGSLSNRHYSLVVWGIMNRSGEASHLMVNLPAGSYNTTAGAQTDPSSFSVYDIPAQFRGVGFLIARFTVKHSPSNSGEWILNATQDLRGFLPNSTAGGGAGGGGVSTFLGLTDTPASYSGEALKIAQINAGETALEFTDTPTLTGTNFTAIPDGALVETYINDDGSVPLTANWDVGSFGVRALTLLADSLTSGRVTFASTSGLLVDDADMTFATDTLTVTKLGAFEAAGAINFASQNMTSVDIDSGTIDGTTIGGTTPAAGTFTDIIMSTIQGGGGSPFTVDAGGNITNVTSIINAGNMRLNGLLTDLSGEVDFSTNDLITTGMVAIGDSTSINVNRGVNIDFRGATTPNNNIFSLNEINSLTGNISATKTGGLFGIKWAEDSTSAFDHTGTLTGLEGRFVLNTASTAGTLNIANAMLSTLISSGSNFTGDITQYNGLLVDGIGTNIDITTATGIRIAAITNSHTGSTNTGLLIEDVSGGLTANYAIKAGLGRWSATPDEITATSAGIAAGIDTLNTEVTTNGDSDLDNVTLANGVTGQIKHIYCVVETNAADTWKITPANMVGGTVITFNAAGEGCTLVYADNEGWVVVANNGGTIS